MKKLSRTALKRNLVSMAYRSFVESVFMCCYSAFMHRMSKKDKRKYWRVNREAVNMGLIQNGISENLVERLFQSAVQRICLCEDHPLHEELSINRVVGRRPYKMTYCRTSRYSDSLIPQALLFLISTKTQC